MRAPEFRHRSGKSQWNYRRFNLVKMRSEFFGDVPIERCLNEAARMVSENLNKPVAHKFYFVLHGPALITLNADERHVVNDRSKIVQGEVGS